MQQHTLTIGLNDKDTYKQIYTTKQAITKLSQVLQQHTSGYTIRQAQGGYTHNDGTFVNENSLIVEIVQNLPRKVIKQLINDIKAPDCLNQESIIYKKSRAKGVFL